MFDRADVLENEQPWYRSRLALSTMCCGFGDASGNSSDDSSTSEDGGQGSGNNSMGEGPGEGSNTVDRGGQVDPNGYPSDYTGNSYWGGQYNNTTIDTTNAPTSQAAVDAYGRAQTGRDARYGGLTRDQFNSLTPAQQKSILGQTAAPTTTKVNVTPTAQTNANIQNKIANPPATTVASVAGQIIGAAVSAFTGIPGLSEAGGLLGRAAVPDAKTISDDDPANRRNVVADLETGQLYGDPENRSALENPENQGPGELWNPIQNEVVATWDITPMNQGGGGGGGGGQRQAVASRPTVASNMTDNNVGTPSAPQPYVNPQDAEDRVRRESRDRWGHTDQNRTNQREVTPVITTQTNRPSPVSATTPSTRPSVGVVAGMRPVGQPLTTKLPDWYYDLMR